MDNWALSQLVGIGVLALWLGLLAGAATAMAKRWPEQREWRRKVVHVGCGPVILLAWWLGIDRNIAIGLAGLITALAALNHRLRVLPAIEDVGRASYGTVAYGAAVTLLLWLYWPDQAAAVAAGVLVMAWGDGLAGLVGVSVASPSWRLWGQRKSVAGTSAMAAASLSVLLLLQAFSAVPSPAVGGATTWLVPIGIALVACLLEQAALLGLDNLTVPLAVGWLWSLCYPGASL
ncbi:dolichol kinase [Synechococcus sp. CCY9201]|uniref:diacylglycerol/polyprenol kinase family protein n=1 Tax=unclassified Synechococcus TaxID=2626047 RepID=UPI001E59A7D2|nr:MULTISPECIES: dolichol kinase [unclassified Synechococcus]MEA5423842.1 dolichol kinase [Synechococcus sp. CCY9202]MEA5473785.1 dolichol kinase [Synechococcus sp. CCY9201]